eukprot:6213171-Pleurochrysis_carterae.AAC.2
MKSQFNCLPYGAVEDNQIPREHGRDRTYAKRKTLAKLTRLGLDVALQTGLALTHARRQGEGGGGGAVHRVACACCCLHA